MTDLPANPDVIVVGAGTAGLSAAKALKEKGLKVAVLEAEGHVGGRCVTNTSAFDVPFDKGGSWLHSAEINPLAKIAQKNGARLHKKEWDWERVYAGDRLLNDAELQEYRQYQSIMWDNVEEAFFASDDKAIEAFLPASPWKETAKHFVAQLNGGDVDVVSATDSARYIDTGSNWLVEGGLGAFVKSLHSDIEVELNCAVRKIDYSGAGAEVTTPKGTLKADQLILTVSTGVLASEAIEFFPRLPNWKCEAIGNLPNGLLNKIGIDFDPAWKEVHQGYIADYHKNGEEFCMLLFGFYDTSLAVGFVAGRLADHLEAEGQGAATDFCLQGLRDLFGNDVVKYVRGTTETAWRSNPNTIGSYSFALPGGADARKVLAKSIDKRLFFAGEATMPTAYSTVHGAYMSGKEVAQQVLAIRK